MRKVTLGWRACAVVVGCSARSAWAQPTTFAPSPDPVQTNESIAPPAATAVETPPPPPPPPPLGFAPQAPPVSKPRASPEEPEVGYVRDARGRLMQTQFDMNRRMWIGGGWAPLWSDTERRTVKRGQLELGVRSEHLSEDGRWRRRFRLIEGEAFVEPLEARGTAFRYDDSRQSDTPLLRISTFWPRPVRHDLYLNVGFWGEVLGVELRPRGSEQDTELRFGGLGGTWDVWHSRDLQDYLRLRVGTALEHRIGNAGPGDPGGVSVTPIARVEMDALLDPAGFHRLTGEVGLETPVFLEPEIERRRRQRVSGSLGYELIFLAVNDQPITLRLAGTAGYRDDLAQMTAHGWDVGAGVGMRVNLWAPPPELPAASKVASRAP